MRGANTHTHIYTGIDVKVGGVGAGREEGRSCRSKQHRNVLKKSRGKRWVEKES